MSGLPHVTEVISATGLIDTDFIPDRAVAVGTAVHQATQFLDENDLDWESLDSAVASRVFQYQRFLSEVKPTILRIEQSVTSNLHQFTGTLDRLLEIEGKLGVLDIKGPYQSEWHGLQLAAYKQAAGEYSDEPIIGRWNLYLHDDRYTLLQRTDRDDWPAFRAALTLFNWRRKHE